MGNVVAAGRGPEPRAPGGAARRPARPRRRADDQQGLRLRAEGRDARRRRASRAGDIDVAVAGGMESMSNCAVPAAARARRAAHGQRRGRRLDDQRRPVVRVRAVPHGQRRRGRRRALPRRPRARRTPTPRESHQKAARATARGRVHGRDPAGRRSRRRRAPPIVVDRDEAIRADTTVEALAALKPAFKKDGTVTAGNAPGVNDGAAALVVMAAERAQRARPHAAGAHRRAGDERPRAEAGADDAGRSRAQASLQKAGWTLDDVDLFELNEAFAVQAVAVLRRARHRSGEGERQRRRGRARPRDRRRAARAC